MLLFVDDIEVDQYGFAIDPLGNEDLILEGYIPNFFERYSTETCSVDNTYSIVIVLIRSNYLSK